MNTTHATWNILKDLHSPSLVVSKQGAYLALQKLQRRSAAVLLWLILGLLCVNFIISSRNP